MRVLGLLLSMFVQFGLFSQGISSKQYIDTYKELAVKEMIRTGVPASITLAQGMLESGNGNSRLARKAHNHFGIKCHTWQGAKIYHDDDRRGECFRKYKSAYESYIDHSDFLVNTSRYRDLFELKPTDYKSWAKGLKNAGYATARDYDRRLIRIIEEHKLYLYDKETSSSGAFDKLDISKASSSGQHQIKTRNNIKYIIAKESDTYQSLTEEMDMMRWQLARYNETTQDTDFDKGDIVYLQPKRNRAERGNRHHIVKQGETMYDISQQYGIKLHKLYQKNLMEEGTQPRAGETLWLRRKKRGEKPAIKNENMKNKDRKEEKDRTKENKETDKLPDNGQKTLEFEFE